MQKVNKSNLEKNIKKRYLKDKILKYTGIFSISVSVLFLAILLITITLGGKNAFYTNVLNVQIDFAEENFYDSLYDEQLDIETADYNVFITNSINKLVEGNVEADDLSYYTSELFSYFSGYELARYAKSKGDALYNTTHNFKVTLQSKADMYYKYGDSNGLDDTTIEILDYLKKEGFVKTTFNKTFFTNADSRSPEMAGFAGGLVGTILMIIIVILASFATGVSAAIYLEEFAPKNKFFGFVELTINNLASIPSIVFGLLGLMVFVMVFKMPIASPLVGGLVLSLMSLPPIIISSRLAISSIPKSLRDGVYGLGASKFQVVFHHVVPYSMPGILTGLIIAVSRAIGETAPLLMIGMVAFMAEIPQGFTSPSAAIPVQILLWTDIPDIGFQEKASALIIMLLLVLFIINAVSVYLRNKFEKKL